MGTLRTSRSPSRGAPSRWNIRQPVRPWVRVVLKIAGIVSMFLVYLALCFHQHRVNPNDTTVPTPAQMLAGVGEMVKMNSFGERWITSDLAATFGRLFWGMLVSTLIAVFIGVGMGCYRSLEYYFGSAIDGMSKMPATGMLGAFFVLLGTGEWLYTGIIAFGTAPRMTQAIFTAARQVPRNAVHKFITLNASPAEQVWNLTFKWILPQIIESVRIGVADAMVFLLAVEFMVGDVGFGYRMKIQSRLLNMSVVYPYLGVLLVSGYLMDFFFRFSQRKICPWFGERENR